MKNFKNPLRYFSHKKDNQLFNLVRDLFLTTLIGGLASVLNYVFNFLAANKLPEDSFSTFSGVLGILYLIQIPALSVQTYFTDLLSKNPNFFKDHSFGIVFKKLIRIALLLVLFTLVLSPFLSAKMEINISYLIIAALSIFGFVYSPMMKGILLGLNKIDFYNLIHLSESVIKLAIFLIAMNFSTDPTWPIVSFGLPSIFLGLIIHLYLFKTKELEENGLKEKAIDLKVGYFLVIITTFLFFNAAFSIDVILINPANRALYASLSLLGKIVYFASVLTTSVLFSYLSRKGNSNQKEKFLLIGLALNLAVSMSVVIVYIFFGEMLIELMFYGKYSEILPLVVPNSLGMVFYSIAFTLINYFLSHHRVFQSVLLGLSIILQVVLYAIWNESLNDAVRNQVITYIVMFIFMMGYWLYTRSKKD